jgi:hypothetical protein
LETSDMLLILVDPHIGLVARNATWKERLTAHLLARKLDHRLAGGACPDGDAALTLRALVLVAPRMRDQLAGRVTQLLAEVAAPPLRASRSRVPVRRGEVGAAADLLRQLVDRLLAPGPLPVQGLAGLHILLTDGAGPLYHPGGRGGVRRAVEQVLFALEPRDGWE